MPQLLLQLWLEHKYFTEDAFSLYFQAKFSFSPPFSWIFYSLRWTTWDAPIVSSFWPHVYLLQLWWCLSAGRLLSGPANAMDLPQVREIMVRWCSSWAWNWKLNHHAVSDIRPNFQTGESFTTNVRKHRFIRSFHSKYTLRFSTVLTVFSPLVPLTSVRNC